MVERVGRCVLAAALAGALLAGCEAPAPTKVPAPTPAPPAPTASPTPSLGIEVAAPAPGARVTSPLVVTGVASASWYFEAVFRVELQAPDGRLLAEAPGQAQGEWMTVDPAPFRAELQFEVSQETPAVIVLTEDETGEDNPPPRTLSIPVILVPAR